MGSYGTLTSVKIYVQKYVITASDHITLCCFTSVTIFITLMIKVFVVKL
jgi:hypothetical protein